MSGRKTKNAASVIDNRTADRPIAISEGEAHSAPARVVSLPTPPKAHVASKAGEYRVIHGRVEVAKGAAELTLAKKRGLPLTIRAGEGAVVWLDHEDAVRMLADDIVEPLNAHPSRVGKVFSPPPVVRNMNAALAAGVA